MLTRLALLSVRNTVFIICRCHVVQKGLGGGGGGSDIIHTVADPHSYIRTPFSTKKIYHTKHVEE